MPDVVAADHVPGQAIEEVGGLGDVGGGVAGEGEWASDVIVGGGYGTAIKARRGPLGMGKVSPN